MTTTAVKFTPIGDRVLVERIEEPTSKGMILLPDSAKKKQERVKVIAVGKGKENQPMPVKAGDIVITDKYAGQEVNLDGKEYLILKADDIMAIIE